MNISHEMIAAYADGTLPEEHIWAVRKYLSEHPDEMEEVLLLMNTSVSSVGESICSDMFKADENGYASPLQDKMERNQTILMAKESINRQRKVDYLSNLTKLLHEII